MRGNKRNLIWLLKYEWKQFCLNTSLHGWKFTTLPKRIRLERWLWFAITSFFLLAAISLLLIASFEFQKNPTILVAHSTNYAIYKYHFPAVTVCSFNKISKAKACVLAKAMENPYRMDVGEIVQGFRLLLQLTHTDAATFDKRAFQNMQDLLDFNNLTIGMTLRKLSPSCAETLIHCKWKNEPYRCDSLFEQVKTGEGYCCAFNYFALKNRTIESTMAPKKPQRVTSCGYESGLEILVENHPDDYFGGHIPSLGHTVLTHNPYEFADRTVQTTMVEMGSMDLIAITPTISLSTENIKELSIETRACLFPNERDLLYFDVYNFHNCMSECRMNLTRRFCGCVPFFYVQGKLPDDSDIKICNLRNVDCLRSYDSYFISSIPRQDFGHHVIAGSEDDSFCSCLPDCDNTDYVAESSRGKLDTRYFDNLGFSVENRTIIKVFFNDLVGKQNIRDVTFNWHSLLAYFGGILSLFIGFSFVSLIEVIYFFTIRLVSDGVKIMKSRRNKQQKKLEGIVKVQVQPFGMESWVLANQKNIGLKGRVGRQKNGETRRGNIWYID